MTNKDLIEALIKKEKIFNFTEDTKAFISLALTSQRANILAEIRGKIEKLDVETDDYLFQGKVKTIKLINKDDILKELK